MPFASDLISSGFLLNKLIIAIEKKNKGINLVQLNKSPLIRVGQKAQIRKEAKNNKNPSIRYGRFLE